MQIDDVRRVPTRAAAGRPADAQRVGDGRAPGVRRPVLTPVQREDGSPSRRPCSEPVEVLTDAEPAPSAGSDNSGDVPRRH